MYSLQYKLTQRKAKQVSFSTIALGVFLGYIVFIYTLRYIATHSKKGKSKQWLRYKPSPCVRNYFSCTN